MHFLFERFNIDSHFGFLPEKAPLQQLPDRYAAWDEMAANFSAAIKAGSFRAYVQKMPVVVPDKKLTPGEQERAMLLLSCFAHGYVFADQNTMTSIPSAIAIPWTQIAEQLGRPPILTHASIVLNNWRLIDPDGPFELDNLATILQFGGSSDESWFYLLTAYMEKVGAKAVLAATQAVLAARNDALDTLITELNHLAQVISELNELLLRMRERCDPYIFYLRIRPFLASFRNIRYNGVSEEGRNYAGGSAAQSSMLQVFDAALGIKHEGPTGAFLSEMRKHMPPSHAAFIEWIGQQTIIKSKAQESAPLKVAYENCLQELTTLRESHLQIVADYIFAQVKDAGPGNETGTGGTPPMRFLEAVKRNTEKESDEGSE